MGTEHSDRPLTERKHATSSVKNVEQVTSLENQSSPWSSVTGNVSARPFFIQKKQSDFGKVVNTSTKASVLVSPRMPNFLSVSRLRPI